MISDWSSLSTSNISPPSHFFVIQIGGLAWGPLFHVLKKICLVPRRGNQTANIELLNKKHERHNRAVCWINSLIDEVGKALYRCSGWTSGVASGKFTSNLKTCALLHWLSNFALLIYWDIRVRTVEALLCGRTQPPVDILQRFLAWLTHPLVDVLQRPTF